MVLYKKYSHVIQNMHIDTKICMLFYAYTNSIFSNKLCAFNHILSSYLVKIKNNYKFLLYAFMVISEVYVLSPNIENFNSYS